MTQPRYRTGSHRKVKKTTPGNRNVTHFEKRKPSKAVCAVTGQVLPGVANERPYKMENMAKTKKRPERPFGGVLSSKAAKRELIKRARESECNKE